MKGNLRIAATLALLLSLCAPASAPARPYRQREHRRPVIAAPLYRHHLRVPVRVPIAVPWHLRRRREFGWVHGLHGGYHWAPGIGWHNLLHRGQYRLDDPQVFLPAGEADWRFRGRF